MIDEIKLLHTLIDSQPAPPNAPLEHINRLLACLATEPESFRQGLESLAQPKLRWLLVRMAESTRATPAVLAQLAAHEDSEVRAAVIDNPNTALDTLWMLANDESADVRYALAENPNVPVAILDHLESEDSNAYIADRARKTLRRIRQGSNNLLPFFFSAQRQKLKSYG